MRAKSYCKKQEKILHVYTQRERSRKGVPIFKDQVILFRRYTTHMLFLIED